MVAQVAEDKRTSNEEIALAYYQSWYDGYETLLGRMCISFQTPCYEHINQWVLKSLLTRGECNPTKVDQFAVDLKRDLNQAKLAFSSYNVLIGRSVGRHMFVFLIMPTFFIEILAALLLTFIVPILPVFVMIIVTSCLFGLGLLSLVGIFIDNLKPNQARHEMIDHLSEMIDVLSDAPTYNIAVKKDVVSFFNTRTFYKKGRGDGIRMPTAVVNLINEYQEQPKGQEALHQILCKNDNPCMP